MCTVLVLDLASLPLATSHAHSAASLQNKLGLRADHRLQLGKKGYCTYLSAKDAAEAEAAGVQLGCSLIDGCRLTPRRRFVLVLPTEHDLSLFTAVEAWLERTPFVQRAVCVTLTYRCASGRLSHHCARAWGRVEPQTKMNLFDKYKEAVLAMLKQEEDDIRCSQLALLPAGGRIVSRWIAATHVFDRVCVRAIIHQLCQQEP